MNIRRRAPGEGKPIKEKITFKGKKLPKGTKFDELPDVLIDGKWTVPVKGNVAFERTRNGKLSVHVGIVHSMDEAKSSVSIYDETLEQFYNVNYGCEFSGKIKRLD